MAESEKKVWSALLGILLLVGIVSCSSNPSGEPSMAHKIPDSTEFCTPQRTDVPDSIGGGIGRKYEILITDVSADNAEEEAQKALSSALAHEISPALFTSETAEKYERTVNNGSDEVKVEFQQKIDINQLYIAIGAKVPLSTTKNRPKSQNRVDICATGTISGAAYDELVRLNTKRGSCINDLDLLELRYDAVVTERNSFARLLKLGDLNKEYHRWDANSGCYQIDAMKKSAKLEASLLDEKKLAQSIQFVNITDRNPLTVDEKLLERLQHGEVAISLKWMVQLEGQLVPNFPLIVRQGAGEGWDETKTNEYGIANFVVPTRWFQKIPFEILIEAKIDSSDQARFQYGTITKELFSKTSSNILVTNESCSDAAYEWGLTKNASSIIDYLYFLKKCPVSQSYSSEVFQKIRDLTVKAEFEKWFEIQDYNNEMNITQFITKVENALLYGVNDPNMQAFLKEKCQENKCLGELLEVAKDRVRLIRRFGELCSGMIPFDCYQNLTNNILYRTEREPLPLLNDFISYYYGPQLMKKEYPAFTAVNKLLNDGTYQRVVETIEALVAKIEAPLQVGQTMKFRWIPPGKISFQGKNALVHHGFLIAEHETTVREVENVEGLSEVFVNGYDCLDPAHRKWPRLDSRDSKYAINCVTSKHVESYLNAINFSSSTSNELEKIRLCSDQEWLRAATAQRKALELCQENGCQKMNVVFDRIEPQAIFRNSRIVSEQDSFGLYDMYGGVSELVRNTLWTDNRKDTVSLGGSYYDSKIATLLENTSEFRDNQLMSSVGFRTCRFIGASTPPHN